MESSRGLALSNRLFKRFRDRWLYIGTVSLAYGVYNIFTRSRFYPSFPDIPNEEGWVISLLLGLFTSISVVPAIVTILTIPLMLLAFVFRPEDKDRVFINVLTVVFHLFLIYALFEGVLF